MKRIIEAECNASGVQEKPEIEEIENVPPLINSPETSGLLATLFRHIFGDGRVEDQVPNMASDDFSTLAPKDVPYTYWTLGSTDPDVWEAHRKEGRLSELPDNHSPLFAPRHRADPEHSNRRIVNSGIEFLRHGTNSSTIGNYLDPRQHGASTTTGCRFVVAWARSGSYVEPPLSISS